MNFEDMFLTSSFQKGSDNVVSLADLQNTYPNNTKRSGISTEDNLFCHCKFTSFKTRLIKEKDNSSKPKCQDNLGKKKKKKNSLDILKDCDKSYSRCSVLIEKMNSNYKCCLDDNENFSNAKNYKQKTMSPKVMKILTDPENKEEASLRLPRACKKNTNFCYVFEAKKSRPTSKREKILTDLSENNLTNRKKTNPSKMTLKRLNEREKVFQEVRDNFKKKDENPFKKNRSDALDFLYNLDEEASIEFKSPLLKKPNKPDSLTPRTSLFQRMNQDLPSSTKSASCSDPKVNKNKDTLHVMYNVLKLRKKRSKKYSLKAEKPLITLPKRKSEPKLPSLKEAEERDPDSSIDEYFEEE